jgi:hypothetical protein
MSYNKVDINSKDYKETVDKIKREVFLEYDFVRAMSMEEVDSCLNEFRKLLEDNYELTEDDDLTTFEGIAIFLRLLIDEEEATLETNSKYNANILLRVFDRLKNQTYVLTGEGIAIGIKRNKDEKQGYKTSVYDVFSDGRIEFLMPMLQQDCCCLCR